MKRKTRGMSVSAKILLPSSIIVIMLCVLMGISSFQLIKSSMVEMGAEEADAVAGLVANDLDAELLTKIREGSQETEEYMTILEILTNRLEQTDIKYLYTLYTDGTTVYYGVDCDETNRQSPGTEFVESYATMEDVFAGESFVQDFIDSTTEDDLITVYKPVKNADGEVVAVLGCDYDASAIIAREQTSITRTIAIGLVCLLLAIILLGLIMKNLTKKLRMIDNKIYDLVNSEGDLTQTLEISTGDEMELIADNVNALLQYIRNIMIQISNNANVLSQASRKMVDSVRTADGNIVDVSATMEEMSASMEETTASLNQIAEAISGVYQSVEAMAKHAQNGDDYASEMDVRASESKTDAQTKQKEAVEATRRISEVLNQRINESKAVEEIAVLTSNILSITDQTNLLALNASIEAARAGEAGKGFAVVAGEIGQLASDSAAAAERIRKVSAEVIESVNALAKESEQMIAFASTTAVDGYDGLVKLSEVYHQDAECMKNMMREFTQTSTDLQMTMDSFKENIDNVNIAVEESAKAIVNVAEVSVELTNSVGDIQKEADGNNDVADQLSLEVGKFKL